MRDKLVAYVERYGSMVSEAGGVVLYAMDVETAESLAALLMDQNDAGWRDDGRQIYDRCERVRVLWSLLGIMQGANGRQSP